MDTGVVWVEKVAGYGQTINIGFRSDSQFLPGGSLTFLEKKHIASAVRHHTSFNSDVLSGAFEMLNNRLNPRIFNDELEFVEFVWDKMGHSIGHDWHPGISNQFVMYKGFLIRVWYVR